MSLSENLTAEEEDNKEENKELKTKDQRLPLVFGVADLKNGNKALPIFHSYFLSVVPSVPFFVLRFHLLLFFTSSPRNVLSHSLVK